MPQRLHHRAVVEHVLHVFAGARRCHIIHAQIADHAQFGEKIPAAHTNLRLFRAERLRQLVFPRQQFGLRRYIHCNQRRCDVRQEIGRLLHPLLLHNAARQRRVLLPRTLAVAATKRQQQTQNMLARKQMASFVVEPFRKIRHHFACGLVIGSKPVWHGLVAKRVARRILHEMLHALPFRFPFVGAFGFLEPLRRTRTHRIVSFFFFGVRNLHTFLRQLHLFAKRNVLLFLFTIFAWHCL
mmetsp:Transcript_55699/g.92686  ORF Transcript_55699/g.92686 Transcript_55699/m.92686 type:complete len:240 (-) Transcript_55699:63-782(-)